MKKSITSILLSSCLSLVLLSAPGMAMDGEEGLSKRQLVLKRRLDRQNAMREAAARRVEAGKGIEKVFGAKKAIKVARRAGRPVAPLQPQLDEQKAPEQGGGAADQAAAAAAFDPSQDEYRAFLHDSQHSPVLAGTKRYLIPLSSGMLTFDLIGDIPQYFDEFIGRVVELDDKWDIRKTIGVQKDEEGMRLVLKGAFDKFLIPYREDYRRESEFLKGKGVQIVGKHIVAPLTIPGPLLNDVVFSKAFSFGDIPNPDDHYAHLTGLISRVKFTRFKNPPPPKFGILNFRHPALFPAGVPAQLQLSHK
jgi:hypothetical protein